MANAVRSRHVLQMLQIAPVAIAVLVMTFLTVNSLGKVYHKEDVVALVWSANVLAEVTARACTQKALLVFPKNCSCSSPLEGASQFDPCLK